MNEPRHAESADRTVNPESTDRPESARPAQRPDPTRPTNRPEPAKQTERERPEPARQTEPSRRPDRPEPTRQAEYAAQRPPEPPEKVNGDADKLALRLQQAVTGFVDQPRHAVEEADHVLDEALANLRSSWQGQGAGAKAADTEELRVVLRQYREVVQRLLSPRTG
jgi:hypothetical protein